MSNWADNLKSLDLDGVKSLFDPLAGEHQAVALELGADRKLVRRSDKKVLLDARKLANALETLGRLPAEGESFHIVSHKRWASWDLVKSTLELARPATITHLTVATLGFSKANLEELLALLDNGQIGEVTFVYSVYFRSLDRENCERLAHELGVRGQKVLAVLQHAKLLLLEMTDGRSFVAESSANLRSCSSIEQTCFTHDAALLSFHRGWIDSLFRKANQ